MKTMQQALTKRGKRANMEWWTEIGTDLSPDWGTDKLTATLLPEGPWETDRKQDGSQLCDPFNSMTSVSHVSAKRSILLR